MSPRNDNLLALRERVETMAQQIDRIAVLLHGDSAGSGGIVSRLISVERITTDTAATVRVLVEEVRGDGDKRLGLRADLNEIKEFTDKVKALLWQVAAVGILSGGIGSAAMSLLRGHP
jgi:hypothetical protein